MLFVEGQKTAYEIRLCLVGSEMCIRDRSKGSIIVLQFLGKCLNLHAVAVCDLFRSLEA